MDIPSLFMIPSAVSSGKVHSVFPNSTDADFDFNRDSSATRVNSQGLIEEVGYFGSELVTNGSFDADSNWSKGTGWTINGGKANANNTSVNINQNIGNQQSKKLKIEFDVIFISGTYLRAEIGGTIGTNITSSGKYSIIITPSTTSGLLYIYGGSFTGSIDNVSVKEVTGDRARLNYEIEGGLVNTKPSLLLEPQSTNLIENSSFQGVGTGIAPNLWGTFDPNFSSAGQDELNGFKIRFKS